MSVPFPYTRNGTGAGIGMITTTRGINIKYRQMNTTATRFIDVDDRLCLDGDTMAAMISSLSACPLCPLPDNSSCISIADVPVDFSIRGASCGAAIFLALLGVRTNVVVTGYFVGIGTPSPNYPLCAVDCTDAKITYVLSQRRKIIVPFTPDPDAEYYSQLLASLLENRQVTTYAQLIQSPGQSYNLGTAMGLADLAQVLKAMDTNVDVTRFDPQVRKVSL